MQLEYWASSKAKRGPYRCKSVWPFCPFYAIIILYFVLEENDLHKKMEAILSRVQKPARYVGGEWGSVTKDKAEVDLRFAFCFPDTY